MNNIDIEQGRREPFPQERGSELRLGRFWWLRSGRYRLQEILVRLLNHLGMPGIVKAATYNSRGIEVEITVGIYSTTIKINGQYVSVSRWSGRIIEVYAPAQD